MILAGPTKTGKSTLVKRKLEHKDTMFDTQFDDIMYYATNANAFEGMKESSLSEKDNRTGLSFKR